GKGQAFHSDIDRRYLLQKYKLPDTATWSELLTKSDIVTPAIVMAIAAEESGYMTSDFAKNANNIFGRTASRNCNDLSKCTSPRSDGLRFLVFQDLSTSIANQINYLNRHANYEAFRQLRKAQRNQDGVIDSSTVVYGLDKYCPNCRAYGHKLNERFIQTTSWYKYDSLAPYIEAI
ncbi:MAG: glucosaminidase domain-containing protein, partial [Bdellovibrionales bacterium]|nr:glucosaminidase domain-containing protein [Bdellovibrionales bacterium]